MPDPNTPMSHADGKGRKERFCPFIWQASGYNQQSHELVNSTLFDAKSSRIACRQGYTTNEKHTSIKRIHLDRAAGGDCHHRHLGGHADACLKQSQGKGPRHPLHEQHTSDHPGLVHVCR